MFYQLQNNANKALNQLPVSLNMDMIRLNMYNHEASFARIGLTEDNLFPPSSLTFIKPPLHNEHDSFSQCTKIIKKMDQLNVF